MGDTQDGRPTRRRRWVGRAVVAAVIPVGLVTGNSQPAFALVIPPIGGPDLAPDSGSDPVPNAPLTFPAPAAQTAAPPAEAVDPLAAAIMAESNTTQKLGEQVKALEDELAGAHAVTEAAHEQWARADADLQAIRAKIEPSASATPSGGTSASESASPASSGTPSASPSTSTATGSNTPSASGSASPSATSTPSATASSATTPGPGELSAAIRTELDAHALLEAAQSAEGEVAGRHGVLNEQFQRHQNALATLTSRNVDKLAAAVRQRDAYEMSLAASRGASTNVAGMQANPNALAVVDFALRQLGKPYLWAEEGPDAYDCSGLVLAAYQSVGIKLPRIANTQYGAGEPVLASQLLPGDLVFFSTNKADWRQIHHVAIYLGNNQVVHAPTFGDVVKISPLWWSEYFGASRILPAIPVPGSQPTTATPESSPTATADPTAPPTTAPPTTAPTTTQPPATESGSPTPSGTQSATSTTPPATTAGTPTDAPATQSPTPAPTPDPQPTTNPVPTPTPDPQPTPSPQPAVSPTAPAPTTSGRRRLFRR